MMVSMKIVAPFSCRLLIDITPSEMDCKASSQGFDALIQLESPRMSTQWLLSG